MILMMYTDTLCKNAFNTNIHHSVTSVENKRNPKPLMECHKNIHQRLQSHYVIIILYCSFFSPKDHRSSRKFNNERQ